MAEEIKNPVIQEGDSNKESFKEKKGGRRHSKPKSEKTGFRSCNDWKWYFQNGQVATDASNITYGQIVGTGNQFTVMAEDDETGKYTVQSITDRVPGIMQLRYIPSIGWAEHLDDNVNIAARLLYTYVRHVNSGSRNYEAPDLMTYVLGTGQAYAFYAFICRLYGILNTSNVSNRYINRTLMEAAGGNYDDLIIHIADLRAFINLFAVKLSSLAIPKDFYLLDRYTFLPSYIFTDGDNAKSQMYIFRPQGFYFWDGTHANGSSLKYRALPSEKLTYAEIVSFANEMLSKLIDNEDIAIMSGDILKSFQESGIKLPKQIAPEYIAELINDDGMKVQIHNALALGVDVSSVDITQNEQGALVCKPLTAYTCNIGTAYLDSWMSQPTPQFNMEATRLMNMVDIFATPIKKNNAELLPVKYFGSELLTGFTVYTRKSDGTSDKLVFVSTPDEEDMTNICCKLSKFDWHPIIYGGLYNEANPTSMNICGDLQNYTLIDATTLNKMHNAALQSMLNIYNLYLKTGKISTTTLK
jgi:hypothetical protein